MKNIKIDDICRFRFLSNIKLDSKGENACFVVHQANKMKTGYNSNLWVYLGADEKYNQITSFDKGKNFIWDEDDKHIIFQDYRENKDESTKYYKVDISGGQPEEIFKINKTSSANLMRQAIDLQMKIG